MTQQEYNKKKTENKKRWLEKVMSQGMSLTRDEEYKIRNEALLKFEEGYPPYK